MFRRLLCEHAPQSCWNLESWNRYHRAYSDGSEQILLPRLNLRHKRGTRPHVRPAGSSVRAASYVSCNGFGGDFRVQPGDAGSKRKCGRVRCMRSWTWTLRLDAFQAAKEILSTGLPPVGLLVEAGTDGNVTLQLNPLKSDCPIVRLKFIDIPVYKICAFNAVQP